METKQIHFRVPLELYESFIRLFPGQGERSAFLRGAVERATQKGEAMKKAKEALLYGDDEA